MDPSRFVKVTGVDLRLLIAAAYDLSRPQGAGELHVVEGPIPDQVVDHVMAAFRPNTDNGNCALSMDYVLGRAVKMNVWKSGEDLYLSREWFDHTEDQMQQLLDRLDVDVDS